MRLDIFENIANFISSEVVQVVLSFLSFIPKIMYFLTACLLSVIDFFQLTFRKIAGLDPVRVGGDVTTGDSIYKIIMDAITGGGDKYSAISTAFWAIIILGIFILSFIFISL